MATKITQKYKGPAIKVKPIETDKTRELLQEIEELQRLVRELALAYEAGKKRDKVSGP